MRRLTLGIMSKLLFDTDTEAESDKIGNAVLLIFSQFRPFGLPFAKLIAMLPHARDVERAKDYLDRIIYQRIKEHRKSAEERGDLLSLLMLMENEDGEQMTDIQIRDEVLTLFLAGHESVANALTWTWYLVSQHPQVEANLHEEIDAVLGGNAPTFDSVPQLCYTEMVFTEAMRLFPPSWALARFVTKDYHVGGYTIPTDSVVIMSQYVVQRDPRYFPDPGVFDPERWRPEAKAARPRYSYFPFGGGPRRCIGESFSLMQGILLIATLAQRWRMQLVRNHPVKLEPVVTLRPKYGLMMELEQRRSE
jgi:cytochrome P450